MKEFEMVFRGAVHRHLKNQGLSVHRVIGVVPDTREIEVTVVYENHERRVKNYVFEGYFDEFIEAL